MAEVDFGDAACTELAMDYNGNACLMRAPWHSLPTPNNAEYHTDFPSQFDDGDNTMTPDGGMSPYTCGFLCDDDALPSPTLLTALTPPSSSDAGSACDSSYEFTRFGLQNADYATGLYQGYPETYHLQNMDEYEYAPQCSSGYYMRPSEQPLETVNSFYPQGSVHTQGLPSSPPNYATLMAVGGPAAYATWKAAPPAVPTMSYAPVSAASLSPFGFLSGVTGDRCVKGE